MILDPTESALAGRLKLEREARGWALAALAERDWKRRNPRYDLF